MGIDKQGYECRQATNFAMELTMPKVAIDYFIQEKKVTDIRELAKSFAVSEVIMRDRLIQLGWIY